MKLELDDREREALAEVLRSYLSELRTEAGHTDRQAYREQIKQQEETIRGILARLDLP